MSELARKFHMMSANSLAGNSVRNSAGEDLGRINDFMIDLDNGHIVYAVLSFGGFMGIGDKLHAIPWEALAIDLDERRFVLNIDREDLENAPGFDKDDWPATPNREFVNRVHTHYGYKPYFDESGNVRQRRPTTVEGDLLRREGRLGSGEGAGQTSRRTTPGEASRVDDTPGLDPGL